MSGFRSKMPVLLSILLAALVAAWVGVFSQRHRGTPVDSEENPRSPSRLTVAEGERGLQVEGPAQASNGLLVAALQALSQAKEAKAYGVVMETQGLIDQFNSYSSAKAQVEKAQASLDASRREFQRLKALHAEDRNVSEKALQAAEGTWRGDEAVARAALQSLFGLEGNIRQQWGPVLAQWVFEGAEPFNRLVRQEDLLIHATLPSDVSIENPPATARVGSDTSLFSARLLSASPRSDPRIQGKSYFYLISGRPADLLPGMNVVVRLNFGAPLQGVLVPSSAVVFWQGKAWIYLERRPNRFVRAEIPTGSPAPSGWFVEKGLAPGQRIVVSGSALLLSEELRGESSFEEEGP